MDYITYLNNLDNENRELIGEGILWYFIEIYILNGINCNDNYFANYVYLDRNVRLEIIKRIFINYSSKINKEYSLKAGYFYKLLNTINRHYDKFFSYHIIQKMIIIDIDNYKISNLCILICEYLINVMKYRKGKYCDIILHALNKVLRNLKLAGIITFDKSNGEHLLHDYFKTRNQTINTYW